jgi:DNA-directed RNA polymerase specialized sigma subunit
MQKVIDLLESVKKLDELIIAKEAEYNQLMTMATNITPQMTGMPHAGGVTDKVGNYGTKLAMKAQETHAAWDRYIDQRCAVTALLELLPAKEYGVLHREYIRYMTQEAIAQDMGYCTVQIWRIKQDALESLKHVMECNGML